MSLLITSSRQEQFHKLGGAESELGIENPAQYRNTLRSPLQIKADSEVAVQSIKCVRESGVFTVTDDMNCRFLIIFGNELSAVGETIMVLFTHMRMLQQLRIVFWLVQLFKEQLMEIILKH